MALEKLLEVIEGALTWPGYDRSLEIAKQAREVFAETSEGQKDVIAGIRAGESAEALALRLRVSNPVTGAALAGPLSFQSKIARAPERQERFTLPDTTLAKAIEYNFERFFDGDTLYGYLFQQSCIANNHDPGRWIVYEKKDTPEGQRVYPVEVSSESAIWQENDEFGELLYLCFVREESARISQAKTVMYRHWWIYGREMAAEAIEIKQGVKVPEGWQTVAVMENFATRLSLAVMEYEINLPFVPAIQLGAYRDKINHECNALFYQAAVPMLRDMMNKSTTLQSMEIAQGFAKRFAYVKECRAVNEQGEACQGGYYGGYAEKGKLCRSCNGSGKVKQASELDEVELLWPEGQGVEAMIELSKLIYDHRPPIEGIAYFNDKLNAYFRLIGALVFNQDLTEGVSMKTATEIRSAEDSITNHLLPMSGKIENAWEMGHLAAVAYAGADPGRADASLAHPDDMMITSLATVLEELSMAKGVATIAAVDAIQKKILHRLYKNEAVMVADAMAYELHRPWRDKEPAVAASIAQSRAVDDIDRVIFENFARIQSTVQAALNGLPFSKLNWAAQRKRIQTAAEGIILEMKTEETPEPPDPAMFNFDPASAGNGNGTTAN